MLPGSTRTFTASGKMRIEWVELLGGAQSLGGRLAIEFARLVEQEMLRSGSEVGPDDLVEPLESRREVRQSNVATRLEQGDESPERG